MHEGSGGPKRKGIVLPEAGTAEEILALLGQSVSDSSEQILEFADLTERLRGQQQEAPREEQLTLLLFELARETYGVALAGVLEILRVGTITRVPGAPRHVRGVMNVRGRIMPVVELRTRITLEELELTPAARVVVVEASGRTLGVLVDAVSDILRAPRSAFSAPPGEVVNEVTDYVSAVGRFGERLVLLVDLERALRVPGSSHQPRTNHDSTDSEGMR